MDVNSSNCNNNMTPQASRCIRRPGIREYGPASVTTARIVSWLQRRLIGFGSDPWIVVVG